MRPNELQLGSNSLFFLRGVAVALLLVAWCVVPVQMAGAQVIINEFLAAPANNDTGDANGDGERDYADDEFVELINTGDTAIDIGNWTISDDKGVRHTFPANTVLAPECGIVVFGGGAPAGLFGAMTVQIASTGELELNNTGDTITLKDASDTVADEVEYGSAANNGQSLVREVDGDDSSGFKKHSILSASGALFSPGVRTDGSFFDGCTLCSSGPVVDRAMIELFDDKDTAFLVDFCGLSNDGKTWTYHVYGLEGRGLSNWQLGFMCYDEVEPNGWTPIQEPDKWTGIDNGIKWEGIPGNFTHDEFSFTMSNVYTPVEIDVGVKTGGSDEAKGKTAKILGPSCATDKCVSVDPPTFGDVIYTLGAAGTPDSDSDPSNDDYGGYAFAELTFPDGYNASMPPEIVSPSNNILFAEVFKFDANFKDSFDPAEPLSSGTPATGGEEKVILLLRAPEERASAIYVKFYDECRVYGKIDPEANLFDTASSVAGPDDVPGSFALLPNYPNPFNPETTLRFDLPEQERITLTVYDVMGREVIRLVDQVLPAGQHKATWNGRNASGHTMASGVYLVQLKAGQFMQTRHMTLLK